MTAPKTSVLDFASSSFTAAARRTLQPKNINTQLGVAIPEWFSMADRHQLMNHLNPVGTRPVVLVSSALAAVYGRYRGNTKRAKPAVLCLDTRLGWSAALVHFEAGGPRVVAGWGIPPHDLAGRVDGALTAPWCVDHMFKAAAAVAGTESIRAVLVVDDFGEQAALVGEAVRQSVHPLARCPVLVGTGKKLVTGGTRVLMRLDGMSRSVGSLAHALAVRVDGDPEQGAMHVVVAEHAPFQSTARQLFELGPDDGTPLYFDVYEQHRGTCGDTTIDHRLVVRVHLARERGYDQKMMVTFELGANGLLSIGPAKAWRLDWQPGSLNL